MMQATSHAQRKVLDVVAVVLPAVSVPDAEHLHRHRGPFTPLVAVTKYYLRYGVPFFLCCDDSQFNTPEKLITPLAGGNPELIDNAKLILN
jgi:hypothetical protein